MARRGRPPASGDVIEFRLTLRLRGGEDDDLITFFQGVPRGQRITALKAALRAGGLPTACDEDEDDGLEDMADNFLF